MTTCKGLTAAFSTLAMLACLSSQAHAAQCGNGPGGFEAWKQQFGGEARAKGVGGAGIAALQQTTYASATIAADRSLHSFKLSLDQFLAKRGAPAIVARGRAMKQRNAALFASIEQRYGVLKLIDRGTLSGSQRGSMHGEIGQTQFLPKTMLEYGVGNLETSSGALTSTANFLKAQGWKAGARYQAGEPNFAAIEAW